MIPRSYHHPNDQRNGNHCPLNDSTTTRQYFHNHHNQQQQQHNSATTMSFMSSSSEEVSDEFLAALEPTPIRPGMPIKVIQPQERRQETTLHLPTTSEVKKFPPLFKGLCSVPSFRFQANNNTTVMTPTNEWTFGSGADAGPSMLDRLLQVSPDAPSWPFPSASDLWQDLDVAASLSQSSPSLQHRQEQHPTQHEVVSTQSSSVPLTTTAPDLLLDFDPNKKVNHQVSAPRSSPSPSPPKKKKKRSLPQPPAKKPRKRKKETTPTAYVEASPNDIVCARGRRFYTSPSSIRFRQVIHSFRVDYGAALTREERADVITHVIRTVQEKHHTQPRFLKYHPPVKSFSVMQMSEVRDKVGHALRTSIADVGETAGGNLDWWPMDDDIEIL